MKLSQAAGSPRQAGGPMSDPRDEERARKTAEQALALGGDEGIHSGVDCPACGGPGFACVLDAASALILRALDEARREDREEFNASANILAAEVNENAALVEAAERQVEALIRERDEALLAAENTAHLAAQYQRESSEFMAEHDWLRAELKRLRPE